MNNKETDYTNTILYGPFGKWPYLKMGEVTIIEAYALAKKLTELDVGLLYSLAEFVLNYGDLLDIEEYFEGEVKGQLDDSYFLDSMKSSAPYMKIEDFDLCTQINRNNILSETGSLKKHKFHYPVKNNDLICVYYISLFDKCSNWTSGIDYIYKEDEFDDISKSRISENYPLTKGTHFWGVPKSENYQIDSAKCQGTFLSEKIRDLIKKRNELDEKIYKSTRKFIIVDPRIVSRLGVEFCEIQKKYNGSEKENKFFICSANEFFNVLYKDENMIEKMKEKWKELRNMAIQDLTHEYPRVRLFLLRTEKECEILLLKEEMHNARIKFINGELTDAIVNSARCLENLCKILYGKSEKWNTLLIEFKEDIIREFSKNTWHDLMFIKEKRNAYSHSTANPTKEEASEIIDRATLIFNQYLRNSGIGII